VKPFKSLGLPSERVKSCEGLKYHKNNDSHSLASLTR